MAPSDDPSKPERDADPVPPERSGPAEPVAAPAPVAAPQLARDGTRLFTRGLFWVLLVGAMFAFPLIKAMRSDYPATLPFVTDALELQAVDVEGRDISFADLAGRVLIVGDLPLANRVETEQSIAGLMTLRRRLRGLGEAVRFVMLAHGSDAAALAALADERGLRTPSLTLLHDPERTRAERLRATAGARSAEFLLLDRHARVRGAYLADEDQRDLLVVHTGFLANWPASDPPLGEEHTLGP